MRTQIAPMVSIILAGTVAIAQDEGTFSPVPAKLHVKKQATSYYVAPLALDYLSASTNEDGSWGAGENSIQTTSLAVSAFVRQGETAQSAKYGAIVAKAHKWLLASEPKETRDKVAVIVALSDYYTLHRTASTKAKVDAILQNLDSADGVWRDLLCITRLSDETKRPVWAKYDVALKTRYAEQDNDYTLDSADAFLSMYVAACVKHDIGGRIWAKHLDACVPLLLAAQRPDGAFSTTNTGEKSTATALASLVGSVSARGVEQFHSLPVSPQRPQSAAGTSSGDIDIPGPK